MFDTDLKYHPNGKVYETCYRSKNIILLCYKVQFHIIFVVFNMDAETTSIACSSV